jgi:predicted Zn-dependent peptidase
METLKTLVDVQLSEEKAFLVSLGADNELGTFRVPPMPASYGEEPLRKSSVLRGPEIFLRERHLLPLVHFGFFYVGGRTSETPDNAGLTEVLSRSILEYRARTAPLELLALEISGARFEPVDEDEFFGIRLTVTSNTVDRVFGHIVDWLRAPAEFSASDIDSARRSFAIELDEHCGDSCRSRMEALQEIFPDQPYGFTALALSRPLPSFTPEQLRSWRDRLTVKIFPVFVVSGDVSGTSFLEGLVSRLSDASFSKGKLPDLKASYAENEPVTRRWRDRTLLAFEGPRAGSDYVEMLDVTGFLMAGRAGRVEDKLRAEKLGYYFEMGQQNFSAGGVIEIEIRSASDRQDEAVKAALAAVRDTRESTVPPSQFRGTQVKTILRLLTRQLDPATFLADTMRAVLAGEQADYATRYRLNIRQLRMGEVEMAIGRYLAEDQ